MDAILDVPIGMRAEAASAPSWRAFGLCVILAGPYALLMFWSYRRRVKDVLRRSASTAVTLACGIAGSTRPHLTSEWRAHLEGDPDSGIALSPGERLRAALGFVVAASRMRLRDVCDRAGRSVDWVLRTDTRSYSLVAAAVGSLVVYLVRADGMHELITQNYQSCAGLGTALVGLVHGLRRVRGIEVRRGRLTKANVE